MHHYRLHPALARACARLNDILGQSSDTVTLSDAEYARACREIYGLPPDDPIPTRNQADADVPPPAKLPPRRLTPALARSAARLEPLLAKPHAPGGMSAADRERAIREIYGLPPEADDPPHQDPGLEF